MRSSRSVAAIDATSDDPAGARVVSLVPSATETLLAWGITPVAVTRFCEQPGLPTVGGTKNPDVPAIVRLSPDVVVMCPEENRLEDAQQLRDEGIDVHAVEIDGLEDVATALGRLARAVGVASPDAPSLPPPAAPRCRAFVPIWRRPWMTLSGRSYGSSVLEHLGVQNAFADSVTRYPEVDVDAIAARHVDVVLAPSEPYPFGERHRAVLERIAPVVFVDGKDLFWWGVRTPLALRRLGDALRSSC
jgi:ABC-type Fe3+-hydroxamate transport system substrate-binding protein